MIVVEPLAAVHLGRFQGLFEASSSSCFCRYWHFVGTKNEWLDRCAHRPEENLAEQHDAVQRNEPSARGLVALDDEVLVGWMKIAPREAIPKLTSLPVYRSVPSEPGTWTIGCFLVHPSWRRRHVARALVAAAPEHVRAWGGLVLEAHPRRSAEPLHDEEAWQGPERVFVEHGFSPVHDVAPYPVYRKLLLASET